MQLFRVFRVGIRVPLALLWTFAVHWFLIRVPQLFSKGRRLRPISLWGRGLAFIMGVRIHRVNEMPEEMGDIVISNHMGFLDIPILLRFFPAVFVIKMEMRRVFYFGGALDNQGHVFVQRDDQESRHRAREGIARVLKEDDRIIVFPEGRASSGWERRPFAPASFTIAKEQNKTVQACIIDYLPDRSLLKWDISQPMAPQLISLLGRRRIDVSVEFLPIEPIGDPVEAAAHYQHIIEEKLKGPRTSDSPAPLG